MDSTSEAKIITELSTLENQDTTSKPTDIEYILSSKQTTSTDYTLNETINTTTILTTELDSSTVVTKNSAEMFSIISPLNSTFILDSTKIESTSKIDFSTFENINNTDSFLTMEATTSTTSAFNSAQIASSTSTLNLDSTSQYNIVTTKVDSVTQIQIGK